MENKEEICWEEYAYQYKFAIEMVNGSILSFDPELQKSAYHKFLEISGLSEQQIIDKLENGVNYVSEDILSFDLEDEEDYDRVYNGMTILEYSKGLGFYVDNREIVFHNFEYLENEDQYESPEVLKALGWELKEIGECNNFRFTSSAEVIYLDQD